MTRTRRPGGRRGLCTQKNPFVCWLSAGQITCRTMDSRQPGLSKCLEITFFLPFLNTTFAAENVWTVAYDVRTPIHYTEFDKRKINHKITSVPSMSGVYLCVIFIWFLLIMTPRKLPFFRRVQAAVFTFVEMIEQNNNNNNNKCARVNLHEITSHM